jgi:hypothetical protein
MKFIFSKRFLYLLAIGAISINGLLIAGNSLDIGTSLFYGFGAITYTLGLFLGAWSQKENTTSKNTVDHSVQSFVSK